jgi:hypothetical protein
VGRREGAAPASLQLGQPNVSLSISLSGASTIARVVRLTLPTRTRPVFAFFIFISINEAARFAAARRRGEGSR